MTGHELRMAMKDALDPYAQVQICADLCGCTREEMENRLLDLGVDFPKKRGRKPGPKPAEPKPYYCPVCGEENPTTYYLNCFGKIAGCDCCMTERDAAQWEADHNA